MEINNLGNSKIIMKRFLMFVVLCAVAFVACENGSTDEPKTPVLNVTSQTTLEFKATGGEATILYTLSNATADASNRVTATEDAEWIEVVDYNTQFVIVVSANDGAAREAVITLSYPGAKSAEVAVKQAARGNAINFEAKRFEGKYWGVSSVNTYNYYVVLSDIGTTLSLDPKANGSYYFFDFYCSASAGVENGTVLPNGTYTFDASNSYKSGTFSDENSWFARMDANGGYAEAKSFKSATVKVSDNKFEATITMTNGDVHNVIYEGDLAPTNDYSTLAGDYNFTLDGATITATNYGDSYELGKNVWYIEVLKDTTSGDMFQIEVLTSSADNCFGLYSVYSSAVGDPNNKFLPGTLAEDGLACSWYARFNGGKITGDVMAPLTGGMIKIEDAGSGKATVTIACTDDVNNKIEGTINGNLQLN